MKLKDRPIFFIDEHPIEIKFNKSILEHALKAKIPLSHSCGGHGTCGTCRVIVKEGLDDLQKRNSLEEEMAKERNFSPKERLACQTLPVPSLHLKQP